MSIANQKRVFAHTGGGTLFDESYYEGGKNISNYSGYTNLEDKFAAQATDLIDHFRILSCDRVIDFGCAHGGLMYQLLKRGVRNVRGTDISHWAVERGREQYGLTEEQIQHYTRELLSRRKEYLLFLDVLEHMPTEEELGLVVKLGAKRLTKKTIIRVPIAANEGEDFYLECSRNDVTHYQCHSKEWWLRKLEENGLVLEEELNLPRIYMSKGVLSASFKRAD